MRDAGFLEKRFKDLGWYCAVCCVMLNRLNCIWPKNPPVTEGDWIGSESAWIYTIGLDETKSLPRVFVSPLTEEPEKPHEHHPRAA